MGVGSLDPGGWPANEVAECLAGNGALGGPDGVTGGGARGVVVGSTGPFAQLAGRYAVELGGSSVDAAIVTALTQVALVAGAWVSYAGIVSMVHYDAATSTVHSLGAGFSTFAGEADPGSIPAPPRVSGRTALVPGFLAGIAAAHEKFGVLTWADLFLPAIFVAEHGFVLDPVKAHLIALRRDVLVRQGRSIFFGADGQPVTAGATFRQPQLAHTLRRVAAEGAAYCYTGDWARQCVTQVRALGGRAALEDLTGYQVAWQAALRGHYRGHEVFTVGAPHHGGAALVEGLRLMELVGVGDPTASGEALYWLAQITRQAHVLTGIPAARRTTADHAQHLWSRMHTAGRYVTDHLAEDDGPPPGGHSDYVLAADHHGNITATAHSINTTLWGDTGIIVGGVPLPDAAARQQSFLTGRRPGAPVPNGLNPTVLLRDGRPVLACAAIGSGLHEVSLQAIAALAHDDRPLTEVIGQPMMHAPEPPAGDQPEGKFAAVTRLLRDNQPVATTLDTGFPAHVLNDARQRGLITTTATTVPRGHWAGIQPTPTGSYLAARTGGTMLNGTIQTC